MLAALVGLLIGLGAAFGIDYLDDSIRTQNDIAQSGGSLPVLAAVPIDPPIDNLPVSISQPDDPAIETYRTLRTNVQFMGLDRSLKVIEVTSGGPGEGKTTTATNLAVVLAKAGNRVVLVDADLRRPRIHEVFALPNTRGLTDILLGDPAEGIAKQVLDNLSVITSGAIPPNPSEMLSGQRMDAMLHDLQRRFDYVILDTAPVLPVTDAVAMSQLVDGVLLVIQAGRTSRPNLTQTLASLRQVAAPLLGYVLNRARMSRSGRYGYGYGYTAAGAKASKQATPAPAQTQSAQV